MSIAVQDAVTMNFMDYLRVESQNLKTRRNGT